MNAYYCRSCRLPHVAHDGSCPSGSVHSGPLRLLIHVAQQMVDQTASLHLQRFGIGAELDSQIDPVSGELTLRFRDRSPLVLPAQPIGVYVPSQRLFRWAWSLGFDSPALTISRSLRDYAIRRGWQMLARDAVACGYRGAAEFTALAMLLSRAHGVHEVPFGSGTSAFVVYSLRDAAVATRQASREAVRWVA